MKISRTKYFSNMVNAAHAVKIDESDKEIKYNVEASAAIESDTIVPDSLENDLYKHACSYLQSIGLSTAEAADIVTVESEDNDDFFAVSVLSDLDFDETCDMLKHLHTADAHPDDTRVEAGKITYRFFHDNVNSATSIECAHAFGYDPQTGVEDDISTDEEFDYTTQPFELDVDATVNVEEDGSYEIVGGTFSDDDLVDDTYDNITVATRDDISEVVLEAIEDQVPIGVRKVMKLKGQVELVFDVKGAIKHTSFDGDDTWYSSDYAEVFLNEDESSFDLRLE